MILPILAAVDGSILPDAPRFCSFITAASSRIALEIHGLEFSQLMELEEYLKTLEGVANVTIEEFADGIQNMEIEYDGDAIMLARSLNKSNLCKNMGLKVKNITKNKVILKIK